MVDGLVTGCSAHRPDERIGGIDPDRDAGRAIVPAQILRHRLAYDGRQRGPTPPGLVLQLAVAVLGKPQVRGDISSHCGTTISRDARFSQPRGSSQHLVRCRILSLETPGLSSNVAHERFHYTGAADEEVGTHGRAFDPKPAHSQDLSHLRHLRPRCHLPSAARVSCASSAVGSVTRFRTAQHPIPGLTPSVAPCTLPWPRRQPRRGLPDSLRRPGPCGSASSG